MSTSHTCSRWRYAIINEHLLTLQTSTVAQSELMDQQPELEWRMRPYLIDFIVEIHSQFRLRPEVLYLAVNIVDRYVSRRVVYKKHYQLVGCAALWIAAKFEDYKEKVPGVRDFYDFCCGAYEQSAFVQMEGHILTTVNWVIGHPTAESWLRTYTMSPDSDLSEDLRVQHIARFLMEFTLFDRTFINVRPSLIAWASLSLARFICGKRAREVPSYLPNGQHATVFVTEEIDKLLSQRIDNLSDILSRKYSPVHYMRASVHVREFYRSGRRFAHYPETPSTSYSSYLPTPITPASPWSDRNVPASPGGSSSCASSDAGDDEPITPITPIQTHPIDYVSAKENIAPTGPLSVMAMVKETQTPPTMSNRPILHAVPSQQDSTRAIRH